MLTSNGNQYLRPEYLTPLPTTLDAKKSPLALLAQTCSQIGADTPNTKSLLPPLDKTTNKKSDTPREKSSPASSISSCSPINVKSSFKPYDSNLKETIHVTDDKSSNRVKTPVKSMTPAQNGGRCSSNHSASSPRSSPSSRKTPASQELPATSKSESSMKSSPPPTKTSEAPAFKSTSSSTFTPVTSAGFLAGYPGCPLPLDVMASSLLSHPLKPGLNPYFSYTRMKTANGTDALVPVCRDPYCTGCQLSSHLLGSPGGKGTCPAGCAQCEGKAAGFLPTAGHHTSAVAAAYAHAQLAALAAASQLPYVCSWIAGDATYCGKRFSNSEELLQHLRTHTSDSLLTSPSSHPLLHRTYPTPPLSPLSTARYHPYSKPPLLPPSLTSAFPLPPHPGLPPYFSPYALYGPRLGTSSGMHP